MIISKNQCNRDKILACFDSSTILPLDIFGRVTSASSGSGSLVFALFLTISKFKTISVFAQKLIVIFLIIVKCEQINMFAFYFC
jgi:hypothetical protein